MFEGARFQGVEEHSTEEDYSSWLLPAIKRLLSQFAVSLAELDSYAVCAGPGSFTGLRVGLTTVKAWAEIYCKPIVALSRLEALTLSGRTAQDRLMPDYGSAATYRFIATYFDARREQVFAALYRQSGGAFKAVEEESVTGLPNFLAWVRTEAKDEPGIVLSGHTDVVPVEGQNWTSDPFTLTSRNGRLYGRGSADMKGFIASCLAMARTAVERDLKMPIHFAFSYDEEVGCIGVRRLITMLKNMKPRPRFCLVGEAYTGKKSFALVPSTRAA